jgi:acetyl-CoA carboxylase carboxyl transferase subunit beta
MNWLTRLIELPKQAKPKEAPEGLWVKCPSCNDAIYHKELLRGQMVCPKCAYHHRISAEQRAEMLFDKDTFEAFDGQLRSEDPLSFKDKRRYRERLRDAVKSAGTDDAVRNYVGDILGRTVSVSVFEFGFMGGSMGSVAGEKIVRGMERALDRKCPYLLVTASGGARMQEGILSLMQMAKTSAVVNRLHAEKLPFVCLLTDPTMGGVSASVGWLGDVILAEPGALIGFAGPRVIQETVGQELPKGFQRPDFLVEHGLIDAVVDRRQHREYLSALFGKLCQRPYRQS